MTPWSRGAAPAGAFSAAAPKPARASVPATSQEAPGPLASHRSVRICRRSLQVFPVYMAAFPFADDCSCLLEYTDKGYMTSPRGLHGRATPGILRDRGGNLMRRPRPRCVRRLRPLGRWFAAILCCVAWSGARPVRGAAALRTVVSGRYHYSLSYPASWQPLHVAGASFAAAAPDH